MNAGMGTPGCYADFQVLIVLRCAGLQFVTLLNVFALAWAQADRPLTFEVASIKPAPASAQETEWGPEPGGRFSARGTTLKQLTALAYGVQEYQISGGPRWMTRDRWSIEGAEPWGAPQSDPVSEAINECRTKRSGDRRADRRR